MAARHLLQRGHRSFAFVQEPQESFAFLSQGQRRNRGFLRTVADAGIDPESVHTVLTSNDIAGGRKAMHEVIAKRPAPTAVFAHHDVLAAGLLLECRRQSVRVPADLAVVGFDDIEAAAMTHPPLTTVSNPAYETGLLAGILLKERMLGTYKDEPRTVTLPCRLIRRATA
jgi:LacI family transcriptional regulator